MTEKPLHVRVAEALGWRQLRERWLSPFGPPEANMPVEPPRYDTDWSVAGPLIEKYRIAVRPTCYMGQGFEDWSEKEKAEAAASWDAYLESGHRREISSGEFMVGTTPLRAVCNLILALAKEGKLR